MNEPNTPTDSGTTKSAAATTSPQAAKPKPRARTPRPRTTTRVTKRDAKSAVAVGADAYQLGRRVWPD
jgi:hypothetical protein